MKESAERLGMVFVLSVAGLSYLFGWEMMGVAAVTTLIWLALVWVMALPQRSKAGGNHDGSGAHGEQAPRT